MKPLRLDEANDLYMTGIRRPFSFWSPSGMQLTILYSYCIVESELVVSDAGSQHLTASIYRNVLDDAS